MTVVLWGITLQIYFCMYVLVILQDGFLQVEFLGCRIHTLHSFIDT